MKMRVTESGRRRLYLTRHMFADADGDVVNIDSRSVDAARALGYVEDIGADAPVESAPAAAAEPKAGARKRGRPRKAQAAPKEPVADPFEGKTVPELREIAEDTGVDLPSGYVKRDELVEMIEDHGDAKPQQDEKVDKVDTAPEKGAPWSWSNR